MAQAPCLLKLHITCRLYRLGDRSILLHCSSYNISITSSNRLSSPNLDLDLHSTNQARWLRPLAGISCLLVSSNHPQPKEALPGESPHPKHRWFNARLPLLQFRPPVILRPPTQLAASRLGRYSVRWDRDNYSNNNNRLEWVSLLLPSLKVNSLPLVLQGHQDPLHPYHQLLDHRVTSLPNPLVRPHLLFSRVHQGHHL